MDILRISMSEYGLGTEALPGAYRPSQSGRLQAGRPPLPLHGTGPRPPDSPGAMGPAGHHTGCGHGPGRDWTHRCTCLCGPSQLARLQVRRPSLLSLLHSTGPWPADRAIGAAGHFTVCGHGPGRDPGRTHRSTGACGPGRPS